MNEEEREMFLTFEAELALPNLSDEDVRNEFYNIFRGTTLETEEAALAILEQRRPNVARRIREELGRL